MSVNNSGPRATTNGQLYNPELLPNLNEPDLIFRISTKNVHFAYSGPSKDLIRLERILLSGGLQGIWSQGGLHREQYREATDEQEAVDDQFKRELRGDDDE